MRSGRPDGDAPGLRSKPSKSGKLYHYWYATPDAVAAGYDPAKVRLHETTDDAIASRCLALQGEMREWMASQDGKPKKGPVTLNDLVRDYRLRPESPFHAVKWNTKATYGTILDKIERAFGKTPIDNIKLADLRRWYDLVRYPDGKGPNCPDQLRTAHFTISMIYRIARFGTAVEVEGCDRLVAIIANTQFQAGRKRKLVLDIDHVRAVIETAHAMGRGSIALGTALQWDCILRQRDVIGEWEPIDPVHRPVSEFVMNGRQWVNGLTWAHISDDGVLTKATTKTGAVVMLDLKSLPMAKAELDRVDEKLRRGPVIIDESSGKPYAATRYPKVWREVARRAGIPDELCNMDARAGGATEAADAGASISDIRPIMGHTDTRTTTRYVRGDALEPARRVAQARADHRSRQGVAKR